MTKSHLLFMVALLLLYVGINSCGSSESKPLNPNGDSELALLMRDMHENGMVVKQQLLAGQNPDLSIDCEKLFTAKPTEPDKVADPRYAGYAKAYESAVKSFRQEYNSDRVGTYHTMVDACMNCHKEVCPGPMVKIKRMYLSEEEMASLEENQE
ncbi:MAG TPA: hypothetical protein VGK46_06350 [Saprospiraceae bacterium]